jgi:acyl-CoA thioester hydrolase
MNDHQTPQKLGAYPLSVDIEVAWGDMDAFQHVNNTVYLRFFETARIALFQASGLMEPMQIQGIGPILGQVACTFKFPLTFPDRVRVGALVSDLQEDRFYVRHAVWSLRHDRLAAFGHGRIVMIDYRKGGKVALPADLRQALEKFASKDIQAS